MFIIVRSLLMQFFHLIRYRMFTIKMEFIYEPMLYTRILSLIF